MKSILASLTALSLVLLAGCRSTSNLPVVENFDVNRYLGTWYEAARYPHHFEKGLSRVTAHYSLNPDGTIRVVNRGYNADKQKWEEAVGKARFKDDPTQGWLKVSFFGPFYASYKILYLDNSYTEAIITGPTYNYLWILMRNPVVPQVELDRLMRKADGLGFDTNRLEIVDHPLPQE